MEARATTDLGLAQKCTSGNASAQRELFVREKRRVHATLYRILGSNSEIEDLLQDTFLRVFRSLPAFRGEASLSTWIDRIAVRVAFEHIGRRRPATARLSVVPEPASHDASAEERTLAREASRRLYAAMDRLPPNQRIAYTLHVVDGRSLNEVAEVMGASLVVTKARAWRAGRVVERLAANDPCLKEYLGEKDGDR